MKKLCAAVLSLLLCLSILPLAALGEESGTTTTTTSGESSSTEPAGKLQAAVELHVDKEGKRIAAIVSLPEQESPAELVLTLLVDGEEKGRNLSAKAARPCSTIRCKSAWTRRSPSVGGAGNRLMSVDGPR